MTVRECYLNMNADYDVVVNRLKTTDNIIRFLKMLLNDNNYSLLCDALEARDYESAFQAAHTLKGVTLNLSLTELAIACDKLTEALRSQCDSPEIWPLFDEVKILYANMKVTVNRLLEEVSDSEKKYHINC